MEGEGVEEVAESAEEEEERSGADSDEEDEPIPTLPGRPLKSTYVDEDAGEHGICPLFFGIFTELFIGFQPVPVADGSTDGNGRVFRRGGYGRVDP
ncbi:hypothetical protein B0H14DRAFT_3436865 [Mycena olivaceomarginata]|nr:hypothetical protein B0H14DRAFT_3436865 [Mycena olivaceomarginata]